MYRSRETINVDAAERVFGLSTKRLAWAVLAEGFDATHPAFYRREEGASVPGKPGRGGFEFVSRVRATYDFSRVVQWLRDDGKPLPGGLSDEQAKELRMKLRQGRPVAWDLLEAALEVPHNEQYEARRSDHCTHIAGILGGNWPEERLVGVCPEISLYDLRVFDAEGKGDEVAVLAGLDFVRWFNSQRSYMRIHGVLVALSVGWESANYACGHSPVCEACNNLVRNDVVVVAPAGNQGLRSLTVSRQTGELPQPTEVSLAMGITDPGNAESVITVGSTHRSYPDQYGPSYFSSRGPTVDGRPKPDLLAPGEKIEGPFPGDRTGFMDGTSLAAAHVAGAAALLMARDRDLVGDPRRVKRVLCDTATDLGRERTFQGYGLVDVLRALQSI